MTKNAGIISPANTARAHRRRLPAIIEKMNAKIRDGKRLFMAGEGVPYDFTDGMFPYVVRAFRKVKGWTVDTNDRWGKIRIRLPGEPIGRDVF